MLSPCEICKAKGADKLQAKCTHDAWLCKLCVVDYPYAIDICLECDGVKPKVEEKKDAKPAQPSLSV